MQPDIFSGKMRNLQNAVEVRTKKDEYQGPLDSIVHRGLYFFASKAGSLIGTYRTFDEAMESLLKEAEYLN